MNDSRIAQYLAGRKAFQILTGEIDKAEHLKDLRDGYAALLSLNEDGQSIRDIAAATGISQGKVEKDVRAARYMHRFPKVDPVLVVKVANVATETKLSKATADAKTAGKGMSDLLKKHNADRRAKEAAKRAAAEGAKTPEQTETPETPEQTSKRAARPNAGQTPDKDTTPGELLKAHGAISREIIRARETGAMDDAMYAQAIKDAEYHLTLLKGAKVKKAA